MTYTTRALPDSSNIATGFRLRLVFAGFGILLAIQAMWILIAESYRPHRYLNFGNPIAEFSALAKRERTHNAAVIAAIRGDLWAESALAAAGRNGTGRPLAAEDATPDEKTRTAVIRTLRLSPHRGDVWLLFAAMVHQYRWPGYQAHMLLKMSYYTAPNDLALLPLRLELALRIKDGIGDDELRELARRDVQIILMHDRALKPALVNAYRSAPAEGRSFLEQTIMRIDPNAISAVRPAPPRDR